MAVFGIWWNVVNINIDNSAVDVDVWIWPLGQDEARIAELQALLSPDERIRAGRIKSARAQQDFITARARMRQCLARYGASDAAALQFDKGLHGKPSLKNADLQFNLSHTSGWAALAVTAACAVGIDLEAPRLIDLCIAERFFSKAEARALAALSPSEQASAFLRVWTAKEAAGKALGLGLGLGLASFKVRHDREQQILRIPARMAPAPYVSPHALHEQSADNTVVSLRHFSWPADICGCVAAVTDKPLRLHFHDAHEAAE